MTFLELDSNREEEVITLFTNVFTQSEGAAEGQLIGELVNLLIHHTSADQRMAFGAFKENTLVSCVIFSQLRVNNLSHAFLLSPMAVATAHQNQGIGQALIRYGLEALQAKGAKLVMTYGDPQFYSKIGFQVVSDAQLIPPFKLSYPQGWQGLALGKTDLSDVQGSILSVEAFNHQHLW